jgi:type II secretory pathway pseudopilin PulG
MRKLISNLSAVAHRAKAERGMSLVEATIILMTLSILTAVLAPSINDYVQDARDVKAKEDVEALGTAVMREFRDVGAGCLKKGASVGCSLTNRADLLYSDGTNPTVDTGRAPDFSPSGTVTHDAALNWLGASNAITVTDTFKNQLVLNNPQYSAPTFGTAGIASGWRGAYLTAPIGPDPWGHSYQANTVFLGVAYAFGVAGGNADGGTGEGQAYGGWSKDVMVISAGRNGTLETPIANADGATAVGGDDVVYVVSGSTR